MTDARYDKKNMAIRNVQNATNTATENTINPANNG